MLDTLSLKVDYWKQLNYEQASKIQTGIKQISGAWACVHVVRGVNPSYFHNFSNRLQTILRKFFSN